ncbi:MAG: hypothetical protein U0796_12535 [Gemmatales bacterium]
MSLIEVLPEVQTLSRLEKISLVEFLAQELERDKDSLIEPGRSYPVWSPDRAFSAADTLLEVLDEDTYGIIAGDSADTGHSEVSVSGYLRRCNILTVRLWRDVE